MTEIDPALLPVPVPSAAPSRMWTSDEIDTLVCNRTNDLRLRLDQAEKDVRSLGELRKLDSSALEAMCQGIEQRFYKLETGLSLVMAGLEKLRLKVAEKAPRVKLGVKNNTVRRQ